MQSKQKQKQGEDPSSSKALQEQVKDLQSLVAAMRRSAREDKAILKGGR
jgi:hypothetical protein